MQLRVGLGTCGAREAGCRFFFSLSNPDAGVQSRRGTSKR